MANIAILGAGVMGSALAVPAAQANAVTLIGSPLDDHIITALQRGEQHPGLRVALPASVDAVHAADLKADHLTGADVIVIGVSSPGVDWAAGQIEAHKARPGIVALVTKGLVAGVPADAPPRTYAEAIDGALSQPAGRIVGIGGPCIARELALELPTRVSFACADIDAANDLRALLQTHYYRITTLADATALEACAALKNFMCIGVSAMLEAFAVDDGFAKNPVAALFNQAVREIAILSDWIGKSAPGLDVNKGDMLNDAMKLPAFDLAGLGDLHVTVGGGRNSRLGRYLGQGLCLSEVMDKQMKGVTVEGVDTGRQLLAGFQVACQRGDLQSRELPLTQAILSSIDLDSIFEFDFTQLPG